MSRLKELVSKGVRLIVTDAPEGGPPPMPREIPAEELLEPEPMPGPRTSGERPAPRSEVAADVAGFDAVYDEAGITLPDHGWGIDKVAEMLESKRLAPLGREVKATAVMAALEAASVSIRDVIQDALRRDRALDAFEEAKGAELAALRTGSEERIAAIKEEIDAFLREKNREIEGLKQAADAATAAFAEMQVRKRREEDRLHDLVSHFIEGGDNPVSAHASRRAAPKSPPPPATSSEP